MSTQNEHGYGSRRRILDFMLRKFSFNNIKNKLCEANCHYISVLSYELDVWFWFESLTVATFPALDNGQNNILVNRGQNEEIADLVRLESKIHNWRWLKRKIFKQIGKISIGVLFFLGFFFWELLQRQLKKRWRCTFQLAWITEFGSYYEELMCDLTRSICKRSEKKK